MRQYLIERMQLREKNLKYDFLPSMQEIIERPGNPLVYVILSVVICLITTSIIWAAIYKVDIVVSGFGTVMPEDGVVIVSSPYSGIIDEVYVAEDDDIRAGDMLWTLEKDSLEKDIAIYNEKLAKLQVEQEVYSQINEYLLSDDYSQKFEIDTAAYGENQVTADAIVLEYRVYEEDIRTYKTQLMANAVQNIEKINNDISNIQNEITDLEDRVERTKIKTNVSGKIIQMADIKEGSYISSGDSVIGIVPFDKQVVISSYIPEKDILNVSMDMPVYVRLSAYDDTDNESISGRISKIGNVATNIDGYGKAFEVQILLDTNPENLKIGMEGRVDIVLGQRTIMDYFMEPFTDAARDSLRE